MFSIQVGPSARPCPAAACRSISLPCLAACLVPLAMLSYCSPPACLLARRTCLAPGAGQVTRGVWPAGRAAEQPRRVRRARRPHHPAGLHLQPAGGCCTHAWVLSIPPPCCAYYERARTAGQTIQCSSMPSLLIRSCTSPLMPAGALVHDPQDPRPGEPWVGTRSSCIRVPPPSCRGPGAGHHARSYAPASPPPFPAPGSGGTSTLCTLRPSPCPSSTWRPIWTA